MKKISYALIITTSLFCMAARAFGYEEAFKRTPVDTIEVKTVPAAKVIQAQHGDNYFKNSGKLFGSLFRYIQAGQIQMTVPVIGDLTHSGMSFYVLGKDLDRNLTNSAEVAVIDMPRRQVISYAMRGAYTEKNISKARARLEQYLLDHPDYVPDGGAYAAFWNGPFMIGFLKHFEIHIPVKTREETPTTNDE
jgi:hypothetical protein